MFAIELANRLGWIDVDAMLEEMSAAAFHERFAHWLAFPYGDDQAAAGRIASEVHNGFERLIAASNSKYQPEFTDESDFIPLTRKLRDLWAEIRENAMIESRLADIDNGLDKRLERMANK